MAQVLRLATYNVAWFNVLFDDHGGFLNNSSVSTRHDVSKAQQFAAIGAVFRAMDADGIMVIEAPDTNGRRSSVVSLQRFAKHFGLRTDRAVTGFTSTTEQEISFLFDPNIMSVRHDPMGPSDAISPAPRFDVDLSYFVDGHQQSARFSKPPLELEVTLAKGGVLRVIGVHIKSKAVYDAKTPAGFNKISVQNRRKQLAESFWLRARIDQVLAQNASLLIMGDLNDGPGLDDYEQKFGYSSVEVISGQSDPQKQQLFDPNSLPAAKNWGQNTPTSSRFWDQNSKTYYETMLDFIMVSENIAQSRPIWRIWHPLKDLEIVKNIDLAEALLLASDHFPVSVDLSLPIMSPFA
jgi:exonuclease III